MRRIALAIVAMSLAGVMTASAGMTFTSETSFLNAIQGAWLNDFSQIPMGFIDSPTTTFSGGSGGVNYDYYIEATDGLYGVAPGADPAMSVFNAASDLIIRFTSGNVTAVGGHFFLTDFDGNLAGGNVTVSFSDGTAILLSSTGTSFLGYTVNPLGPSITSLTIHSETQDFATADHLYAGAVPEPTTVLSGALLLLPFGMSAWRSFRKPRPA